MKSQSETKIVFVLKLPILKTGDYDIWSIRMEQYLTHTDFALWEVITNEAVNIAHDVHAARSKGQASSSTYADDVMFSYFVKQSNSLQLENEDLEQIDTDDLEEMDLKWQESYQAEEGPTDFALMAHLSSGSSSSSSSNTEFDQQREVLSKANLEIIAYQLGLESLEARIVIHQKNEAVYEEDIAFLKYDVKVRDNSITELKNQLAEALREKDDLKLKLEKFETSSMKLTKLINSQISVNNKSGVGFDMFESASDSSVNEIEEENNQVNDRFKKVEGYHAVSPLYTGNYMPSRPDLSFVGLDNSIYKTNVSETISSVPRIESTTSKSSKDSLEQPKDVRPSAPIIEEEVRPVWNNAQRVNHQNKFTHPHPKRNFVPTTVATKSGLLPVNAAKQKAFSVDQETGQMLKCENDQRRHIVVVEKGLKFVSPIMSRQQQCGGYGPANNLEDSICSMKLRENIDDVSKAIFTTHNPDTVQLSAERCVLKSLHAKMMLTRMVMRMTYKDDDGCGMAGVWGGRKSRPEMGWRRICYREREDEDEARLGLWMCLSRLGELHNLLDKVVSVGTAPGPNSSDHNVNTITNGDGMPRIWTFRETIFPKQSLINERSSWKSLCDRRRIMMVDVGEDEGDAAGAVVVTRWRWMRGGWCGGEDGDVAVVVMVAGAW
ncbi:ribonuclease H-like domain-containing protein [Tanacetum coccineum]